MIHQQHYRKLDGSKATRMRLRLAAPFAAMVLGLATTVTSCNEAEEKTEAEKAIVGDWAVAINYTVWGNSYSYTGDWMIAENGTYRLDFVFNAGGIIGPRSGYSSGNYILLSDSIMIVTSLDHFGLELNYAFYQTLDTLLIDLRDSAITTVKVRMIEPSVFSLYGNPIEWTRQ